jgi:carbamoyltransferase
MIIIWGSLHSTAALVRDGELVAAAEEERFRRVKHWAGFPSKAIAYCLREAGLALGSLPIW